MIDCSFTKTLCVEEEWFQNNQNINVFYPIKAIQSTGQQNISINLFGGLHYSHSCAVAQPLLVIQNVQPIIFDAETYYSNIYIPSFDDVKSAYIHLDQVYLELRELSHNHISCLPGPLMPTKQSNSNFEPDSIVEIDIEDKFSIDTIPNSSIIPNSKDPTMTVIFTTKSTPVLIIFQNTVTSVYQPQIASTIPDLPVQPSTSIPQIRVASNENQNAIKPLIILVAFLSTIMMILIISFVRLRLRSRKGNDLEMDYEKGGLSTQNLDRHHINYIKTQSLKSVNSIRLIQDIGNTMPPIINTPVQISEDTENIPKDVNVETESMSTNEDVNVDTESISTNESDDSDQEEFGLNFDVSEPMNIIRNQGLTTSIKYEVENQKPKRSSASQFSPLLKSLVSSNIKNHKSYREYPRHDLGCWATNATKKSGNEFVTEKKLWYE